MGGGEGRPKAIIPPLTGVHMNYSPTRVTAEKQRGVPIPGSIDSHRLFPQKCSHHPSREENKSRLAAHILNEGQAQGGVQASVSRGRAVKKEKKET